MQNKILPHLLRTNTNKGIIGFGFCFILCFASQASWAQTSEPEGYVLSQRIGLEIDSVEAEYFNIFPELDGVKSAVYRQDGLGNVRMLVSLATGKDTALTFSKLAAEQLGNYITFHEILVNNKSDTLVNWSLLPGYNLNRINYFEDHGSLVEVKTDSGSFFGKLMLVSDSSILLWAADQPFSHNKWRMHSRKIFVKDIVQIERKQDLTGRIFGVTLGAAMGVALVNLLIGFEPDSFTEWSVDDSKNAIFMVGGGALAGICLGRLYDVATRGNRKYRVFKSQTVFSSLKPSLEKRAIFRKIFPPELRNL